MQIASRAFLLVAAVLCCGYSAAQGMSFERNVEPETYSAASAVFWLLIGGLVATPFWLAVAMPVKFPRAHRAVRILCALGCLALLFFFSSSALHGIARIASGSAVSSPFLLSALLSLACILAAGVLLWPPRHGASSKRA